MLVSIVPILSATIEESLLDKGLAGLGLLVFGLVIAKLFAIFLKDRDEAFTERREMTQDLLTKVFPAITRNTEVLEARAELDKRILDALLENNTRLERQERAFEDLRRGLPHNGVNR